MLKQGPEVIKIMLSSAGDEILNALKYKNTKKFSFFRLSQGAKICFKILKYF